MCTFERLLYFSFCYVSAFQHLQHVGGPTKHSTNASVNRKETSHNSTIIIQPHGPQIRFIADPIPEELYTFVDSIPLRTIKPRTVKCKDVLYIKTHKTGSETCATMFRRFGLENNLTLALPLGEAKTRNNLGWPWKFKKSWVYPSVTGKYNILLDHSIFTPEVQYDVMHEDVVTVTSVRDSFSHMKSAFEYFQVAKTISVKAEDPYGEYLLDLKMYDNKYRLRKSFHCVPPKVSAVWNSQALDLGFPLGFDGTEDKSSDEAYIKYFLTNISRQIDVPIIMQYFNESLLVLKYALNWSFKDILYLKRNPSHYKHRTYGTDVTKNAINWNNVDTLLYRLLNRTLWHQIDQIGTGNFNRELLYFAELLGNVTHICKSKDVTQKMLMNNHDVVLPVQKSEWGGSFNVTYRDCYMLGAPLRNELRQDILQNMNRKYLDAPKPWTIPGC